MLSVEGNYYKKSTSESVPGRDDDQTEKNWRLSFTAERFLSDRFSVGIGVDRYWEDAEVTVGLSNPDWTTLTQSKSESNYWMPKVFCKYYLPLKGRLYLVPHLLGSYGKAKAKGTLVSASVPYLDDEELQLVDYVPATLTSSAYEADVNLFSAELAPELVYFIVKRWGVAVCPGGLRYDKVSGDLQDSEWTLSFKRQYWKLGVNFRF